MVPQKYLQLLIQIRLFPSCGEWMFKPSTEGQEYRQVQDAFNFHETFHILVPTANNQYHVAVVLVSAALDSNDLPFRPSWNIMQLKHIIFWHRGVCATDHRKTV